MVMEIFKFESRTSDGESFCLPGEISPVYFVLYARKNLKNLKKLKNKGILCLQQALGYQNKKFCGKSKSSAAL